jgi:class 3 adenylate cyclase/pimeloyl-ACP methyl ester carboxylesterase
MRGPIRYAQSGDVSIAYQVAGEGPFDLVLVPGFISHLEFDWEEPRHAAFLERLSSFSRLIRLDKRGTGLSDRQGGIPDLETRMDDVRAVMDAVGSERAALFGYFEGGPMSILFAATYPERTRALVLFGTYATTPSHNLDEEQLAARVEDVVGRWGDGDTILRFAPDADDVMRAWWGARERLGGSPGAIRDLIASSMITDVRDALPAVQAPTVVLHRTDDPMLDGARGRELADEIPSARFVELPGSSTLPWIDADPLLAEIEEFLTGARPALVADRVFATILFTDLVGSTETARQVGDSVWSRLMEQHHAVVRRELDRFDGEEIDTAGDGFFAIFDGPARAIRCALGIQGAVSRLGLEVRAGLHTGEVERPKGGKPRGLAVNVAARVSGLAKAGEVFVTATTRDLVAGSGLEFADRGLHELKGLGEARHVYLALGPRQLPTPA